jgi:hypothetical protein
MTLRALLLALAVQPGPALAEGLRLVMFEQPGCI